MDYTEALAMENSLPPGPYEVRAFLDSPLTGEELSQLRNSMNEAGVDLINISQNGNILSIRAYKPEPPEGISFVFTIPIFVATIGLLGGLAITFYTVAMLPRILDAVIPLTVISFGGLILYQVIKNRR